jgi:signal transduction histidine kinase
MSGSEGSRRAAGILAYLAGYVALDWISFIHPYGTLGITPWNPPAGLSFALLLEHGWRFAPLLFLAVVTADFILRGFSAAPLATLASALAIASFYGTAAALLRGPLRLSLRLDSHGDLLRLLAVTLAATTLVAATVVAIFAAGGLLDRSDLWGAFSHFWVGDVIGILVPTPFILLLLSRKRRLVSDVATGLEYVLQLGAIGACLWVIFGLESTDHFEFSYLLFLPLIWIGLRHGLRGTSWGIVATQLGLVLAIQLKGVETDVLTQFQLLMIAVAVTGLLLGSVVDERQRAEASLRDSQAQLLRLKEHEAELAHAARLSTTGEMAAALAHELNQPLTAAISFARACETILGAPGGVTEDQHRSACGFIAQTVQQALRAGEIIRSTREFLDRGDPRHVRVELAPILSATLDLAGPEAAQSNVRLTIRAGDLPPVFADPIQIEQVLLNLVRNSIDAIRHAGLAAREVTVIARAAEDGSPFVEVAVRDTGPGFPAELTGRLFAAFATTKQDGMGLGLSISRSIVEAHGGRIFAVPTERGAEIRFTLPVYANDADER